MADAPPAAQAPQFLQAVLDTIAALVVVVRVDGTTVLFNPACERLTQRRAADVIGRPIWETVVPPERTEAVRSRLALLADGAGPLSFENEWVTLDGSRRRIAWSNTLLRDARGDVEFIVATGIDVTDQRAADRELARLADERVREAQEHEALRRVATEVAMASETPLVFQLAAEQAAQLLGGHAAFVLRFEPGDVGLVLGSYAAADVPDAPREGDRVPLAPLAAGEVRLTGLPATVTADSRPDADGRRDRFGSACGVAAPVTASTGVWGAVCVAVRDASLVRDGAEDQLAHFATLIAVALENAERRGQLAAQAATDALTGLANHRHFQERLVGEIGRARRYGRSLSLVVLDLDEFKRVNDTYGHQAGDDVLTELAARLRRLTRSSEVLARLGGDELAFVLPETDGEGARVLAERARAAVAAEPFPGVGRLTASFGICDLQHAGDERDLYRFADGALYHAKAQGRDRVAVYDPAVVVELSDAERAERLARSQARTALHALARAVDAKDPSTQRHSERVAALVELLAARVGWPADRVARLREAALIHDVGKIGVADAVLFKPGPLTPDEYELVKQHAALGATITADALHPEQVEWIHHHHERPDGTGYPDGLGGEAIPDGARLLALADAFDVMTQARHYTEPVPVHAALAECRRLAGRQFDFAAVTALSALDKEGRLSPWSRHRPRPADVPGAS